MFDAKKLKQDFPILRTKFRGKSLVYLDNASTTQKPKTIIDALKNYYENLNSNIHRGIHSLSEKATIEYENVRARTAKFINAKYTEEIIFTKNTTESINLVANTFGETVVKKNDSIIISALEHHSNLLPWRALAKRKKANLLIIPLKKNYELDMNAYQQLLKKKPKLICVTGMSNVTGTIPNIKKIIQEAHKINARVLIDSAQSVAHQATDVQKLGCDFLTFSAHKMLGPTGVGILYGKKELLEKMPPFLYGGDMVKSVEYKNIVLNGIPWKFEAGTPNIADVIAFGKALEYLTKTGLKNIETHDKKLLRYAKVKFSKYPKVKIYSPENTENSGPVFSFTIEGIHPHDIASVFNEENIAIRSGHHCCQPLMESLNISGTARMSFYFYNTEDDIDRAEKALKHVLKIFK